MIDRIRLVSAGVCLTLAAGLAGAIVLDPAPRARPSAQTATPPATDWRVTVRSIVDARGLESELRPGRLLSAIKHRVLDPAAFPPAVLVDGQPARLDQEVPADADVTVVPGRDSVEPVVLRTVHQPADTTAGLFLPGRSGLVELRLGRVSGEVVSRRVLRQPEHGPLRRPGSVLLTFDDGPDPVWTPQVLALLKAYHAHAIFCLIGREARKYPELVRQIVADGHLLCDHTQNHDEHLGADPVSIARAEIRGGLQAIVAATGAAPAYFRAPGGAWTPKVERMVRESGMTPLKWNVDPRDWEHPRARVILARVLSEIRPGSVVLLHDGGGDRSPTVGALRALLHLLPRLRLHVVEPNAQPLSP